MLRSVWKQPEDTPEPERDWHLVWDVLLPGAVAGVVGATAMALVALGLSAALVGQPWLPFQLVAGLVYRQSPPQGGGVVVLGLLIHLAVSGGLATGFALLLPRGGTRVAALAWGELYELLLWGAMVFLLIPFASPPLERAQWGGGLLLVHAVFGAALATIPSSRRLSHRVGSLVQRYRKLKRSGRSTAGARLLG